MPNDVSPCSIYLDETEIERGQTAAARRVVILDDDALLDVGNWRWRGTAVAEGRNSLRIIGPVRGQAVMT